MDGNASSLASFHSLGTRRDYLFTEASRAHSFVDALDSIKVLLADARSPSRPKSVPQLIRAIYDDSQRTTALEQIREVIRPNQSLGFHDPSATGTKLLAGLGEKSLTIATCPLRPKKRRMWYSPRRQSAI